MLQIGRQFDRVLRSSSKTFLSVQQEVEGWNAIAKSVIDTCQKRLSKYYKDVED